MNPVENYSEWKAAVQTVLGQLRAVEPYLNDAGRERKDAMATLLSFADFCDTAEELLAWLESGKDMDQYDKQRLRSFHAQSPIRRLRKIAEMEESGKK